MVWEALAPYVSPPKMPDLVKLKQLLALLVFHTFYFQVIGSIGVGAAGVGAVAVTDFLLEAASKDTDLRVVAESLDKIFDMFAEDDTDQLAVETRLVPRLKGLVNGFKIKLGIEKKKQQGTTKDFDLVVGMAKSNLTRFIKYKEKRPIVAAALNK